MERIVIITAALGNLRLDRRVAGAALFLLGGAILWAIDGLAPSRSGTAAKADRAEASSSAEGGAASYGGWMGFGPSTPVRPQPGQAKAKPDDAPPEDFTEMTTIASAEGDEAARGPAPRDGPTVHGEVGVYGGSSYGGVVVEGKKTAVTISGERSRGWWP